MSEVEEEEKPEMEEWGKYHAYEEGEGSTNAHLRFERWIKEGIGGWGILWLESGERKRSAINIIGAIIVVEGVLWSENGWENREERVERMARFTE